MILTLFLTLLFLTFYYTEKIIRRDAKTITNCAVLFYASSPISHEHIAINFEMYILP